MVDNLVLEGAVRQSRATVARSFEGLLWQIANGRTPKASRVAPSGHR